MTGVEAQADCRQLEDLLDLPWSLDMGAGFVVEGRFVAAGAAARHRHLDAFREMLPLLGVETQRPVPVGLARLRAAKIAPRVGQGGSRLESVALAADRVEDVEQRVQLAQDDRHLRRVVEWKLEETTRQREASPGQIPGQLFAVSEITKWAEVDALVPGLCDLVEYGTAVGYVRQDPDRQLERAIAHGCVGDHDLSVLPVHLAALAIAGSDGWSRGARLWWTATTASHNAMSCSESRPDVTGWRPEVMQSWKWMSSSLKLSRNEVISSVRHERGDFATPSSVTSTVGRLRRKGEGKESVKRRVGEWKANSIE